MHTMSNALSAAGASSYYTEEYEHARGSYYDEKQKSKGRWSGTIAEEFGLTGDVDSEHFARLCDGQHPCTGEQLVRHVPARVRKDAEGKPRVNKRTGQTLLTAEHRAGWDNTFSAPKSVSIAAIIGGDTRIVEAHDKAVDAALKRIEKFVQARPGGNRPGETTGKAAFALFRHDVARPDWRTGLAAPDLHTHAFWFNVTKNKKGDIKPVQPLEMYRSQKYATAVYRAKLAEELRKIGYELKVDKRTAAPEIVGISREYIERMSPRQAEIKEAAEEQRAEGRVRGIVRADGTTSTRAAAVKNRRAKVQDREYIKKLHQKIDREEFAGQAHAVVRESHDFSQVLGMLPGSGHD